MTPEGKTKAKIKVLLKKYGCYQHWPVLNGMGAPTLDCIGVVRGFFFAVEAKAANKQPTPRQEITIRDMQLAGGKAFVVNEVEGMEALELWLQETTK
jgi:hypothetical protein